MYRFNGGYGAVTCDTCDVIFDEGLSLAEYEEAYNSSVNKDKSSKDDVCWKCKENH
jgi:hypothetical protein